MLLIAASVGGWALAIGFLACGVIYGIAEWRSHRDVERIRQRVERDD